jgi:hypothetical protein
LLEQSFNARAHGAEGIGRIVALLRDAECYELTIGELAPAVRLLRELVGAN